MNLRPTVKYLHERYPQTDFPRMIFGEGSYGGLTVYIYDSTTILNVGKFCSFAMDTKIMLGGEHRLDWATTYPFTDLCPEAEGIYGHPATRGNIEIGHDVWAGFGATILSGTQIGHGAVLGAQTVVSGIVPPYAIYAGNPGKVVRYRFPEGMIDSLLRLAWWNWPTERLTKALPDLLSPNVGRFIARAEEGII